MEKPAPERFIFGHRNFGVVSCMFGHETVQIATLPIVCAMGKLKAKHRHSRSKSPPRRVAQVETTSGKAYEVTEKHASSRFGTLAHRLGPCQQRMPRYLNHFKIPT